MSHSASERLLVLDLDETLIHGAETPLDRAADFPVGPFFIYRRPHLAEFLEAVAQRYALAIWSSASQAYVSEIARRIRPENVEWRFLWARERCIQRFDPECWETSFLKDVRKIVRLGYDIRRILMVDDSREKLARNYGNAVYVRPFHGSPADDELPRLAAYLESIRDAENYRTMEKRNWRKVLPSDLDEQRG